MASVSPIEVPVKFTGDLATAFKPGWQTSEFWMTTAMHLLTLLLASGVLPTGSVWEKIAAFALSAIAQATYNQSRGNAKEAVANAILRLKQAAPPVPGVNAIAMLLGLSLLACFATGCQTLTGPTPAGAYVAADHATYDAVAPDHTNYVNADPNLSPIERARRLRTLESWRLRIDTEEQRQAATTQPATVGATPASPARTQPATTAPSPFDATPTLTPIPPP